MSAKLLRGVFLAFAVNLLVTSTEAGPLPDIVPPDIPKATLMPDTHVAADQPPGFVSFCIRFPDQCASEPGAPSFLRLSAARWNQLEDVNRSVNRAIKPMHDLQHYGRVEYWNIPSDGLGDCKDYALTKRQKLMSLGFPQPALRIAIVNTWSRERHAVLTVTTDHGDYVLDNLTDLIRSWGDTDYQWVERQDPLDAWGWMSLAPINSRALF